MIKRVRVSNFKCLGNVDVELGPVTIFIGRSGTGKTAFVESLRFLRDYVAFRGDNALQLYDGWGKVISATAASPVTLSFEVMFSVPGTDEDYRYTLTFQQPPEAVQHKRHGIVEAAALQAEKLSLGSQTLFEQRGGKWAVQPRIFQPLHPGNLILGSLSGIPEVTRAHHFLSTGLGWYSFPDNVFLPASSHAPQDPRFQLPSALKAGTGLWDNGANFLQAFNAIMSNLRAWPQQREMVAALKHLNPSVAGLALRMPNQDAIEVSHEFDSTLLPLELAQESEGLRRFLAFLIALYQSPPKETLIFEEPEKGIHPGALAVLADQFKACAAEGRGQVLLTTHSPQLLDHFGPETLRAVDIDNYQTRIGPVAPEQVEAIREHLLRPGELLTVDPARVAETATAQG
jgi:predicted ATPase